MVAAGDALLAPSITRRLIAEFAARPERMRIVPGVLAELTEREREVTALVAMGRARSRGTRSAEDLVELRRSLSR